MTEDRDEIIGRARLRWRMRGAWQARNKEADDATRERTSA